MSARHINFTPVDIPITLTDSATYRAQFRVDEPAPYRVVLSVQPDSAWAFLNSEQGDLPDSLGRYFDSVTIECMVSCSTDSLNTRLSRRGNVILSSGPRGDSTRNRIELYTDTESLDSGKAYAAVITLCNVTDRIRGLSADLRIKMLEGRMKDIAALQSVWVAAHLIPFFGAFVISFICLILWLTVYRTG